MSQSSSQFDTAATRIGAPERASYSDCGHLTIPNVFTDTEILAVIASLMEWGERSIAALKPDERAWFLEGGGDAQSALRKLDNPHVHLPEIRRLAGDPRLVELVESIIGSGVSVYFSQIFFKPPEGGGPKPAHQDNFYFGPTDRDGLVTAWIALDDATLANGCLFFGEGTNKGPVYPHFAPPGEPFNLQLEAEILARQPMTPAAVRRGGISFHHGNTFHQSGANHSTAWRRACALHYVRNDVHFAEPALPYDHALRLEVSTAS